MKKFRMFATIFCMILCVTSFTACSTVERKDFGEPFIRIWTKTDENGLREFDVVYPAYENQKEAEKNTITIYTDYFEPKAGCDLQRIKMQIVTKQGFYKEEACNAYGKYFMYKRSSEHPAYAYIEIKPLSEKTSDTELEEDKENLKSTEQMADTLLDESLKSNEAEENTEQNEKTEELTSEVTVSDDENSISDKIDFSPIYTELAGIIDEQTIQEDLNDFAEGKWNGEKRTNNNVERSIYIPLRLYIVSGTSVKSVNIDYIGDLENDAGRQYTLVVNGNTVEKWQYFKLTETWTIEDAKEFVAVGAIYSEDDGSQGFARIIDTKGEEILYILNEDGEIEKI